MAPGVLYRDDLAVFPTKRVKAVRTTPGGTARYTSSEFFDGMDCLFPRFYSPLTFATLSIYYCT
ncbi:MAG: hypothetical protein HY600_03930 [Candidatus Omnitrophica bacterium]|nr:hypothetical protein [Candidatus Omnitrophota bacterium]